LPGVHPKLSKDHNMLQRFGELASECEVKFAPVDLRTVEADGTGETACSAECGEQA
jgi:hypothetical protein